MIITSEHGGGCCGINHIHNIPTFTEKNKKDLKNVTRGLKIEHIGLIEIILTTRKSYKWHDAVKDIGYKEVSRFRNPKTGNTCIVYHYD